MCMESKRWKIVVGAGGESRSERQRTRTAAASHQQLQTDFFSPKPGLPQRVGRLAVCWHWDRRNWERDTDSQSLFHTAEVPKSAMPYWRTDPLQQVLLCHNTTGILSNIWAAAIMEQSLPPWHGEHSHSPYFSSTSEQPLYMLWVRDARLDLQGVVVIEVIPRIPSVSK